MSGKATTDTTERERLIATAIASGKFPLVRASYYRKLWDENPVATKALLGRLEAVQVGVPAEDRVYASVGLGSLWGFDKPLVERREQASASRSVPLGDALTGYGARFADDRLNASGIEWVIPKGVQ